MTKEDREILNANGISNQEIDALEAQGFEVSVQDVVVDQEVADLAGYLDGPQEETVVTRKSSSFFFGMW